MFIELRYLYYKANREENNDYMDMAITPEPVVKKAILSNDPARPESLATE
jgi:hypothetical protein